MDSHDVHPCSLPSNDPGRCDSTQVLEACHFQSVLQFGFEGMMQANSKVITDTAIFASLLPRQLRGLSALVRRKRYTALQKLYRESKLRVWHGATERMVP